jgi:hypothetical protein
MADPFRSGGAGPVVAGDPRLAGGLAAASLLLSGCRHAAWLRGKP